MPGPLVYEENVPVLYVPAIADVTAPTVAELTDSSVVALASYIRKDGVQFPSNRNMVDTGSLDQTFDSEYPGSKGGTLVITFKRKNRAGAEAAWTLFKGGLVDGYLVFGFEGSAVVAADNVDVYQATSHHPVRSNPAANTEQTFMVNFGVQDEALGVDVAS